MKFAIIMRSRQSFVVVSIWLLALIFVAYCEPTKHNHGENCTQNSDCNDAVGLVCTEKKCFCGGSDPKAVVYSPEKKQCVGLSGHPCAPLPDDEYGCTKNTECTNMCDNFEPKTNRTTEKEVCWKECLCPVGRGFIEIDGQCKQPLGTPCTNSDSCTIGLQCVQGHCGCDETLSEFSPSGNSCLGLVGKPCFNKNCVENAECMDMCDNFDPKTNKTTTEDICWSACMCKTGLGFVETNDGHCRAPYGENCRDRSSCGPTLQCVGGVCGCRGSVSTYDSIRQECVGLAHQLCNSREHCVQNADCKYLCDNVDPKTGEKTEEDICYNQCLCPADYLAEPPVDFVSSTPAGFCRAHEGGPCGNSNDNCVSGLPCQDGQCRCPYGEHYQYYDKEKQKCLTLTYGPSDSRGSDCTPFAFGYQVSPTSSEVFNCRCGELHVEDGTGKCFFALDFGEACPRQDYFICNTTAKLFCTNGKCVCEDALHVYDEQAQSCRGLVGSWCSPEDSLACVAHARCNTKWDKGNRVGQLKGICECDEGAVLQRNRTCTLT